MCHQRAELSCVVVAVGSVVPGVCKNVFQECIVFCCSDEGKVLYPQTAQNIVVPDSSNVLPQAYTNFLNIWELLPDNS